MHQVYEKHAEQIQHIEVLQHPLSVQVKNTVKAKALYLVAASTRLDKKQPKEGACVGTFDTIGGELFVLPQFVAPLDKDGNASKLPCVCPFWAVASCKKEDDANMDLVYEPVKVHTLTVQVPVLTNKRELKAGTELCWFKKLKPCKPGKATGADANAKRLKTK